MRARWSGKGSTCRVVSPSREHQENANLRHFPRMAPKRRRRRQDLNEFGRWRQVLGAFVFGRSRASCSSPASRPPQLSTHFVSHRWSAADRSVHLLRCLPNQSPSRAGTSSQRSETSQALLSSAHGASVPRGHPPTQLTGSCFLHVSFIRMSAVELENASECVAIPSLSPPRLPPPPRDSPLSLLSCVPLSRADRLKPASVAASRAAPHPGRRRDLRKPTYSPTKGGSADAEPADAEPPLATTSAASAAAADDGENGRARSMTRKAAGEKEVAAGAQVVRPLKVQGPRRGGVRYRRGSLPAS